MHPILKILSSGGIGAAAIPTQLNNQAEIDSADDDYFRITDGAQTGLDGSDRDFTLYAWVQLDEAPGGPFDIFHKLSGNDGWRLWINAGSARFNAVK